MVGLDPARARDHPHRLSGGDRIAVLHVGRLVEVGPTATVLAAPAHPYTRELVVSAPRLEPLVAAP